MALGNILRVRKEFAECADAYAKGIETLKSPQKPNWLIFYFRGICYERSKQWAERRSRLQARARALARAGARAQLSRLFVDRPGHQSRRRHADDPPRGRAAAGRRLHRGFARLGLLPHPQLRRGGEASRARGRAQARGPDHQRSSRRRLLEGRTHAGSRVPVGACARPQAGAGRSEEDRREAPHRPGRRARCRPRPPRPRRSPATAADFAAVPDCFARIAGVRSRQGQPDAARAWAAAPTAITRSKVWSRSPTSATG